jgi:hypothetical protein
MGQVSLRPAASASSSCGNCVPLMVPVSAKAGHSLLACVVACRMSSRLASCTPCAASCWHGKLYYGLSTAGQCQAWVLYSRWQVADRVLCSLACVALQCSSMEHGTFDTSRSQGAGPGSACVVHSTPKQFVLVEWCASPDDWVIEYHSHCLLSPACIVVSSSLTI